MLNYDDLLVARMLNRARPDLTRALSAGLDAIAEGLLEQGLLATLVARGRVDSTAAAQAQGSIASHLGARALEAYVATLGRAGLDLGQVAQQRAQLGDSGTAEALGARLVAAGLLTQERHRAAMNEAAQAEQRLQAEELQRYVEGRRTQLATLGEPQAAPSGAEPAASAGAGAAGPGFAIPDWVDTTDERVGTEVAGYRILGRIGAGAMGIVYLVDHPDQPERPVALKLLLGAQSEEAKGRFKREILANSLFSHEGILEVYDAGETDDGPYLAMEFFDGVNLADLLEVETKLPPYHALFLARHFFSALGKAHEAGVIHRDIKPDNLLVGADGQQAKLMDFGIAVIPGLEDLGVELFKTVASGLPPGTPRYMAPERTSPSNEVTEAADIYSMGLVLYELLAGKMPFHSETARGYINCHLLEDPEPLAEAAPETSSLPPALHTLIERLLEKEPDERPQIAEEVVFALNGILSLLEPTPPAQMRAVLAESLRRRKG